MTREHDEFIAIMTKELAGHATSEVVSLCRKLGRMSKRHARLQEALCNGDWPADNGVRPTVECPLCGMGWATGTVHKTKGCKDCRLEADIRKTLEPYGIEPIFSGDPRGCTVKLKMPSGTTNDWGREGVCVPQ